MTDEISDTTEDRYQVLVLTSIETIESFLEKYKPDGLSLGTIDKLRTLWVTRFTRDIIVRTDVDTNDYVWVHKDRVKKERKKDERQTNK